MYTKIHDYVLVPKSFMKFMFSTVNKVTQKDFYVHPYTSKWAPDLRQRIVEAVEFITPHTLINTWRELEYRLDQGCQTESLPTAIWVKFVLS
jgi:hypothetical protein